MTLVSSIILDAYREANMIALGKALTTDQSTEALRLLQAVIDAIYGTDAGEILRDWPLGNYGRQSEDDLQYTNTQIINPTINHRLIATNEAAITIYLTAKPQDGARYAIADPFSRLATYPVTLNANGRIIAGAPTLDLDVDGTFREWMYRADLGAWVQISTLAEDDEMPFPSDFDSMFIILLAMRLSPRYGRALSEASVSILQSGRRKFVARYLNSQDLQILDDISWPFMSVQTYDNQREFSSTANFNRGFPVP